MEAGDRLDSRHECVQHKKILQEWDDDWMNAADCSRVILIVIAGTRTLAPPRSPPKLLE